MSEKKQLLHIEQAIIVEGRYDKIKLSQVTDAVVIETNGFGIYNDSDKRSLIRHYAQTTGIIILTDSDNAGQQIRGAVKSICGGGKVFNAYVPEVFGKEKRKSRPSKEGKLGVEGLEAGVIAKSLVSAGVSVSERKSLEKVTMRDFILDGLSGGRESRAAREKLLSALCLPKSLSAKALLDVINSSYTPAEYRELVNKLF